MNTIFNFIENVTEFMFLTAPLSCHYKSVVIKECVNAIFKNVKKGNIKYIIIV